MTDPTAPVKNPERVPAFSQVDDPVGTAVGHGPGVQIVAASEPPPQEMIPVSIKHNRDSGNFEIAQDGVYENSKTGDRFQFRKGAVVGADVAQSFKRVGPWPGDTDEEAEEATATQNAPGAKAAPTPENKANPAPTNR
jgi:hypothetical protein